MVTEIVQERPTEVATPVIFAVAALIAKAAGIDDADTIIYLSVAMSFVPAAITWLVVLVRGRKEEVITVQRKSEE